MTKTTEILALPINTVIFPFISKSIYIQQEHAINAVENILNKNKSLFIVAKKEKSILSKTYTIGTVCDIVQVIKVSDTKLKIILQGKTKARLIKYHNNLQSFTKVEVWEYPEKIIDDKKQVKFIFDQVKKQVQNYSYMNDLYTKFEKCNSINEFVYFLISNLPLDVKELQQILEMSNIEKCIDKINSILNTKTHQDVKNIKCEAEPNLNNEQKKQYLQDQLKAINNELNSHNNSSEIHNKFQETKMPDDAKKEVQEQLKKLENMRIDSAEAANIRNYVNWLLSVPWYNKTEDDNDINKASKILNEDHYGLEKVKERILEHIAVRQMNKNGKSPILALVGPPGCFIGNTKVLTLDHGQKTLEQMYNDKDTNIGVYSWDIINNKPAVSIAKKVQLTKYVNKLIEIEIDGFKHQCTPDHLWLTINNVFKKTKDLKIGDSLMPLNRQISSNIKCEKYEEIITYEGRKYFTHQLADEYKLFKDPTISKKFNINHHINDIQKLYDNAKKYNNHAVTKIKIIKLSKAVPVYDMINVDFYNNFAIMTDQHTGCFVHNCGKTSLGKSIARALGRKFIRIALGGIRDEAELRGHRLTYIGAMPGKIIQELKRAGVNNPVFMIDEVDKIGSDHRGDPSSALLEILDPEQNNSFVDHYLNVPFDLSNVMFIATANLLEPIQPAFRDRMEIIELSGYTELEKLEIAKNYLVSKQINENGLNDKHIAFNSSGIKSIIEYYTRESGVRNLEREIANVCRKRVKEVLEQNLLIFDNPVEITDKNIEKYLGTLKFIREDEQDKDEIGVSTGLAWTQVGGAIIYIETNVLDGKGNVILTGKLGDVMKESAQVALNFVRSRADKLGIDKSVFFEKDIHVHVPAGATPKDGPSAGITIATSIISALINKSVSKDIAMTGEITIRGKVLPIGGLKEKILAAKRMKNKIIIVPYKNTKDLKDIPDNIKESLEIIAVKTMDEVIDIVFK